MVNGYVFLDLTKSNVYAEALKVLGTDKPVVIKDGSGAPYFVDSLTLDGTNVVITKGGKTITITDANAVSSEGDIQEKAHSYLVNLIGEDTSNNSIYVFMNLLTLRNDLTSENVIDYLKTYLANTKYQINGYNGDSAIVYTALQYYTNDNDFRVDGTDDSEYIFTNISVGTIKQLF